MKQIACRANYMNDFRIMPVAKQREGKSAPLSFGNSCDAPRAVANFDAAQFLARFYVDN